jgi:hypothetical protein
MLEKLGIYSNGWVKLICWKSCWGSEKWSMDWEEEGGKKLTRGHLLRRIDPSKLQQQRAWFSGNWSALLGDFSLSDMITCYCLFEGSASKEESCLLVLVLVQRNVSKRIVLWVDSKHKLLDSTWALTMHNWIIYKFKCISRYVSNFHD